MHPPKADPVVTERASLPSKPNIPVSREEHLGKEQKSVDKEPSTGNAAGVGQRMTPTTTRAARDVVKKKALHSTDHRLNLEVDSDR